MGDEQNMVRKALYSDYYGGEPLLVHSEGRVLNATVEENNWHLGKSESLDYFR